MFRFFSVFVAAYLISNSSHSQTSTLPQCTEFNTPEEVRIYYVNGMLSDMTANNNARTTLEAVVGLSLIHI